MKIFTALEIDGEGILKKIEDVKKAEARFKMELDELDTLVRTLSAKEIRNPEESTVN